MTGQMTDRIKMAAAALLVVAGVAGYYLLSAGAGLLRAGSVVAGIVAGGAVAWFSAPGQQFLAFGKEAITETKKVVWPTRKESFQTTGAVFAFVVVMALFLWLSDKSLEYLLYDMILRWSK
jgi:preprotein translocase subunit SecE